MGIRKLRPKKVSGRNVWALVINHRHGTDVDVFATEDLARESLLEYVSFWWKREMKGDQPSNPYQAVDRYFLHVDESYELQERPVHG